MTKDITPRRNWPPYLSPHPFWLRMETHTCEVCGAVLDRYSFEFCYRCRKYLCFEPIGKEQACAKSHPNHIGYYYCPACLDDLFLCRDCGGYKTRGGRFPLLDHLCEECSRHAR